MWVKKYLTAGVLTTVPLCVTVWFLHGIVVFFDDFAIKFFPQTESFFHDLPGLGIVLTVLFVFCMGVVAHTVLGEWLLGFGDRVLAKTPFVRSVYATCKQLFHAFFVTGNGDLRQVALIEYPHEGKWCVCFITGDAPKKMQDKLEEEECVSVFLPTAPNPTSGLLILVERKKLRKLNMSVEEGMRFVVTAGMALPEKKTKGGA